MKIAFFDSKTYDINSFKTFEKDHSFKFFDTRLTIDTVYLANGYDAVCVFVNDTVNKQVIDKLVEYNVKLILLRCAGYNNVDLEYCYGKIHVFRVPAYSPYAVAEHTIALLLTLVRKIHKAYIRTRNFNFNIENLQGFDLHGKTIGIIGTGKIGKVFIDICKGFGMKVIAYDMYPSEGINYVSLDELFNQADIISLHCPLTKETHHIINKNNISKMKKNPIILNTSRGGLINTKDLIDAIKSRTISGACLDVYEEESNIFFKDYSSEIIEDDVLLELIAMPNVIVTSHQAYLTNEALNNIASTTMDNINDYINNGFGNNELCYGCGKAEECMKNRNIKCF